MWVYDAHSLRLLAANEAALDRYGYAQHELHSLSFLDLLQPDELAPFQEQVTEPLPQRALERHGRHKNRQGELIEVQTQTREIELAGKRAHMVLVRDLAEKQMFEERETFSAVLSATSDAIISTDIEGTIRMFNLGAERIFRRTSASMLGENVELLLPERYRAAHRQHRRRFAESGTPRRMMGLGLVKGLRSDGQELDLEGSISQLLVHRQQRLMVSLRDVTERVQAHQELQQSKALLSDLNSKLLSQEKLLVKRLSQVLHDQLGQTMTAIRMVHETIMASQRGAYPAAIERMERQLGALINQAIRQIRQVLMDLRPPLLEEQGLAAALDNELRNRALTNPLIDISIHVGPETALLRWPGEVEYVAFMIVREAFENALRHSGAAAVSVRLSGRAMALHLEVADNGAGFAEDGGQAKGHLGILGMHERAHAVGAKVSIDSSASQGTRVHFDWEPAA